MASLLMKSARNAGVSSFQDVVLSEAQQVSQPMNDVQGAVLFSLPSVLATIAMALLTMWIYPRAAVGLQNSGKQSSRLCQRILPTTLFQGTVVLGMYQAWSCVSYAFNVQRSLPSVRELPWCLAMVAVFLGVIALHVAMIAFVAIADVQSQMKSGVDDLLRTCVAWDQDVCAGCECSICFAQLSERQDDVVLAPRCGHGFHKRCLRSWLARNPTCPMCRYDLRTELKPEQGVSSV